MIWTTPTIGGNLDVLISLWVYCQIVRFMQLIGQWRVSRYFVHRTRDLLLIIIITIIMHWIHTAPFWTRRIAECAVKELGQQAYLDVSMDNLVLV